MAIILAENEIGYLLFDGNELTIGSKIGDPPKCRLTSPINADGGGGGVISYNASRQAGVVCDGHQQTEMAMDRVEQAEDVRGQIGNYKAERNFMVSDASGDGADGMHKPLAFTYDAVTHDTLGLSGGVTTPPAAGGFPNKLVSPDGLLEFDIQNGDAPNATLYIRPALDQPAVAVGDFISILARLKALEKKVR